MKVVLGGRRLLGLTFVVGCVLAIAFATTGGAVIPTAGVNCQTDGKISGRGATFQTAAQKVFADGFRDDVCGAVGSDAAGDMVQYNYDTITGSGAGQRGQSCRTDAFGGSDIPYDTTTLTALNGAPGAISGGCSALAGITPPYQPKPGPWPDPTDVTAPIMSFPVAGSSVAIVVNLQAADCGGIKPPRLAFTALQVSLLFGGEIQTWNDPRLRTSAAPNNNAQLANCPGAVTRIKRFDKSGTTQIFKNYLKNQPDNARTGAGCTNAAGDWTVLAQDANNTQWPNTGTCSALTDGAANGNGPLLSKCLATPGCVGYADLADAKANATLIRATVRNSTDTNFAAPDSASRANCNFGTVSLPGNTAGDAVGLSATDNWALDNPAGNRGDATFKGALYPICGVTFGLVYTGLDNNAAANNAITRLTANQRRTLYSYELYILSSAGQDRLSTANYNGFPPSVISTLRAGFISNY